MRAVGRRALILTGCWLEDLVPLLPTASGYSVRQLACDEASEENPSQGNSKCAKNKATQCPSQPSIRGAVASALLLGMWRLLQYSAGGA